MGYRKRRKINKEKAPKVVPLNRLIDWYCPLYMEYKDGSTPYAGVALEILTLYDGRFIWQTVYTRDLFANGNYANWRIGVTVAATNNPVCNTFQEALALARAELAGCNVPRWRD